MSSPTNDILILGGGLTGLSAGCVLTRAGRKVKVFESDPEVERLRKGFVEAAHRFKEKQVQGGLTTSDIQNTGDDGRDASRV